MECNIDARGKAVRLRLGVAMTLLGAGLLAVAWLAPGTRAWALWAGIGFVVVGGFGIFEGRKGWCVVRAMGFRTRL